jgi:hypothetical protein
MSVLEFVFDPAGFAGGAAVTALAFSGRSIRNRIQANGVVAKCAGLYAEFMPQYAEWEKKVEDTEARISAFGYDFLMAFPLMEKNPVASSGVTEGYENARKNLDLMLKDLNALDNTHLSSKEVIERSNSLKRNRWQAEVSLRNVDLLLDTHESKLQTSIKVLKKLKNDSANLGDRLKKAKSDYDDAVKRFDRLFLESIPPALFKAEKAYESFVNALSVLVDDVNTIGAYATNKSCGNTLNDSIKTLTTLENYLHRVLVFSDVVKAETSKQRVELRRCSKYNSVQQDIDYDAALESLMEAESRPYDKGNPKLEFEDTIKPFRLFIYNNNKGVYRGGK